MTRGLLVELTSVMSKTISITSTDGRPFEAYVAMPPSSPAPAIIIVPSIFGVTDALKTSIDRYASQGYIVVAPDPFWRTHPGALDPKTDGEAAQARKRAYVEDEGFDDIQRTVAALKTIPEWNGKFGIFGFCFGGKHAFVGLTRFGAEAGASFHGTFIHTALDEKDRLNGPFSLHYGADDHVVPMDQVDQIRAALADKDGEIFVYEGAGHSFALPDAPSYNPAVARLSEERALAVFSRMKDYVVA
jgi:carboxymethylenebutenolidase